MTNAAKGLLLICAASALALGACSKPQAASDAGNTADASAAPMSSDNTGAMSADNTAATNDSSSMSASNSQ